MGGGEGLELGRENKTVSCDILRSKHAKLHFHWRGWADRGPAFFFFFNDAIWKQECDFHLTGGCDVRSCLTARRSPYEVGTWNLELVLGKGNWKWESEGGQKEEVR